MIIDGDENSQAIIQKLKTRYVPSGWREDTFINLSKHDFEEYYPARFSSDATAALRIQDKQAKRDAKRQLLEKVVAWIISNQEQAKDEFEVSAQEIIDILKGIEGKI